MSEPSSPLSERQRQHLGDLLYGAAVANAERAKDPQAPHGEGCQFVALAAEHYAHAALYATQAFMTATQPRGTKR